MEVINNINNEANILDEFYFCDGVVVPLMNILYFLRFDIMQQEIGILHSWVLFSNESSKSSTSTSFVSIFLSCSMRSLLISINIHSLENEIKRHVHFCVLMIFPYIKYFLFQKRFVSVLCNTSISKYLIWFDRICKKYIQIVQKNIQKYTYMANILEIFSKRLLNLKLLISR